MAKYSTDQGGATQWRNDRRYILATWTSKPFVGYKHRHESVDHRLVVEYSHGVGVDVIHEARSDDTDYVPDHWAPVESIEVRDYGARHDRRPVARWFDD